MIMISGIIATNAFAASRTLNGINENEQLGMTAGLALACNAGGKLDDYELIASRIIANTSQTDLEQKKAERQYAEAKFRAIKNKKNRLRPVAEKFWNHFPICRFLNLLSMQTEQLKHRMVKC